MPPEKWARLILERATLLLLGRGAQDSEDKEKCLCYFQKIKNDPLDCSGERNGFSAEWMSSHSSDTHNVKLLTDRRLHGLYTTYCQLVPSQAGNEAFVGDERKPQSVDELLLMQSGQQPNPFSSRFAHVVINLRAPTSKICADFNKWLGLWTESANVKQIQRVTLGRLQQLADGKYLPYFDLRLACVLEGRNIEEALYAELLKLNDVGNANPRNRLKTLRENVESVISLKAYDILRASM